MNVNGDLWGQALQVLTHQMTQATFNAWLKDTASRIQGNRLTVFTSNPYGLDWLENRLRPTIERAVEQVAGREMAVEFKLNGSDDVGYQPELLLTESRGEEYTRTVKPDDIFAGTQYFRRNWTAILGPATWCMILELRQRCYKNKSTGEIRDKCKATYAELASIAGISERQAQRLLGPSLIVDLFILDRQTLQRHSIKQGKKVNEATKWVVNMDEPILTPELMAEIVKYKKETAKETRHRNEKIKQEKAK